MEAADLVVAEYATAWAARRLGIAGVDHVGGLTLMMRLLAEAPMRGWSVYLLGAEPAMSSTRWPCSCVRGRRGCGSWGLTTAISTGSTDSVRAELRAAPTGPALRGHGQPAAGALHCGSSRHTAASRSASVAASTCSRAEEGRAGVDARARARVAVPARQDPRRLWRRYLVTNPWFVWQVYRSAWRHRR
jgi:hypothetical protein